MSGAPRGPRADGQQRRPKREPPATDPSAMEVLGLVPPERPPPLNNNGNYAPPPTGPRAQRQAPRVGSSQESGPLVELLGSVSADKACGLLRR